MSYRILAINPGSTSTKIALYEEETKIFEKSLSHTAKELEAFDEVLDQFEFREKVILSVLKEENIEVSSLSAVVGRGGMLPNMKSGGYLVTKEMIDAFREGLASPHASNLGALLAYEIAEPLGIPAYIYDSVTSDELEEIAKVTGMPGIRRESMCHVLNMKAVSRKVAEKYGKKYEDMNILAAHLGGGISMSVHHQGKIIDCIRDDEGPFSPERSGSIPMLYVVDLCYSGKYTKKEMVKRIRGNGGLKAYLGTQDLRDVEAMVADENKQAQILFEAQAYQIAKGIGEMAPVLGGRFDCIILTGGMAYSKSLIEKISERVQFIAPIEVVPGEDEMEALSFGALRLVKGQEEARIYARP
ncbi:butyrate kinase [Aminipila sp.]|uniref:butyrate kinase n=1 Tax=Aminipila sp. TaxID=2060095 RepID=UPI00289EA8F5|nr:butyrate kinase [Aminipila sp.]